MERAKSTLSARMPDYASKQKQRGYQFSGPVKNIRTNFYKVIHTGIIQEQHLGLPSGFVKKHGNELPGVVSLRVPTGDSWTIKLRKTHGGICLSDGWKEFVDVHSIYVGHVLFFSYNGNGTFHVNICDITTAEIDYRSKTGKSHEVPIYAINKIPEKNTLQNERLEQGKLNVTAGEPSMRQGRTMTPYWSQKAFSANSMLVQRNSATEAAQKHVSDHPSFLVIMQPSYVEEKFALNVPAKFITKYVGSESRNVTLRLPDGASHGREWIARCVVYDNVMKFYDWKDFAEDNDLRIFDVCVFELRDPKTANFTVFIYRNKMYMPRKVPLTSDDSSNSDENEGHSEDGSSDSSV